MSGEAQKVSADSVPVTEVVLFSSGVGYFSRSGKVSGDARLEMLFSSEEINDLLKSLMILDSDGGRVSVVTYASQDPSGKALRAFGLDLSDNPSMAELLTQMRGVRVAVDVIDGEVEGEVVGVEKRSRKTESREVITEDVVSLLTAEGIRSFTVSELRRTRILDEKLDADLRQALEVLARSRDTQKRSVAVEFSGEGERRVKLAYIAAAPVWKTSYRLVIDEEKPLLQGWSILENTTDCDWNDVTLSLVSGRPISFIQDLYTPLHLQRPTVQPQLYAGLRPVVPDEAVGYGEALGGGEDDLVLSEGAPMAKRGLTRSAPATADLCCDMAGEDLSFAEASMSAAAEGGDAGELFRYTINTLVTIARQSSAMLPIVASSVEGRKLSLYNSTNHPTHPYNCYEMTNTTGLSLLAGPVTVFDEGVYAGDAQLPNLQPDEKRLVSYGLDLACTVSEGNRRNSKTMVTVKIRKGSAKVTRKHKIRTDYVLKNKKDAPRTVIVEHLRIPDAKLVEPEQCDEVTEMHYRFPVELEPKSSKTLRVVTESTDTSIEALADLAPPTIEYYVNGPASEEVKEALKKVLAMREKMSEAQHLRQRLEKRRDIIVKDQDRIRKDLKSTESGTKLNDRYLKKLETQEDELDGIAAERKKVIADEDSVLVELNQYLSELTLD